MNLHIAVADCFHLKDPKPPRNFVKLSKIKGREKVSDRSLELSATLWPTTPIVLTAPYKVSSNWKTSEGVLVDDHLVNPARSAKKTSEITKV